MFNLFFGKQKILCTCASESPISCKADLHYCICSKTKTICRSKEHFNIKKERRKLLRIEIKQETTVYFEPKKKCSCANSDPNNCINDI